MKHLRLNITYKCNLGCSYCVSNKKPGLQDPDALIEQIGAPQYLQYVDYLLQGTDTSDLVIDLKGEGDVLQSSEFGAVLIWAVDHGYKVEIQTNLHGWEKMNESLCGCNFFDWKDRQRITVHISYHLGEYLDRPNPAKYRTQWFILFKQMIASGVQIGKVDIPLTPKILTDPTFEDELLILKSWGTQLNPAILVGTYENNPYPQSYTPRELERVAYFLQTYKYDTQKWTAAQIPHVVHQLELKGLLCDIRMTDVDVMANGQIRYCQSIPSRFAPMTLEAWDPEWELFMKVPQICTRDECGCLTTGLDHCLLPNGTSIHEYFIEYYHDQPKIAELFRND